MPELHPCFVTVAHYVDTPGPTMHHFTLHRSDHATLSVWQDDCYLVMWALTYLHNMALWVLPTVSGKFFCLPWGIKTDAVVDKLWPKAGVVSAE